MTQSHVSLARNASECGCGLQHVSCSDSLGTACPGPEEVFPSEVLEVDGVRAAARRRQHDKRPHSARTRKYAKLKFVAKRSALKQPAAAQVPGGR